MSEAMSDMQIEQLEKIIELKNEQIHILAKKLETREQQLKETTERNEKLRDCILRIANKKWFGEVHNDARNTLEKVYKTNE